MKTVALLTPLMLASIKPRSKEYVLYDAAVDGLALRVQPGGAMSWVTWHRSEAKTRRITLGKYPELSLEDAREAFRSKTAPVAAAFAPATSLPTFKRLAGQFLKAKNGVYTDETLASTKIYLDTQLLPALGHTPLNKVTTAQIADWFFTYSRTRPGGANQALGLWTTILNWAKTEKHVPKSFANPASPLRFNKRKARGRLLTSEQLNRLIRVLDQAPARQRLAADAIRLILLTGCRSGEILRLKWSEVSGDILRLGRTKTGPKTVNLSTAATEYLARLQKSRGNKLLFPSPFDHRKPIKSIDGAWRTIKRKAELPDDIRLHDLRHTYASHAIMSGETLSMTGKLLGHSSPNSVERYSHLEEGYLLKAVEKTAKEVEMLLG